MTGKPLLFHQTAEQLRRVAARGGRATARNRRARLRTDAPPPPPPAVPPPPPHAETTAAAPSPPWRPGFPGCPKWPAAHQRG